VPLVTGGGNDPPSLVDDAVRRGISGTGAPTTEKKSADWEQETHMLPIANDICIVTFSSELQLHNLTSCCNRFGQQ
jgi:hypothetical protein